MRREVLQEDEADMNPSFLILKRCSRNSATMAAETITDDGGSFDVPPIIDDELRSSPIG